jgi:hypothetical protein
VDCLGHPVGGLFRNRSLWHASTYNATLNVIALLLSTLSTFVTSSTHIRPSRSDSIWYAVHAILYTFHVHTSFSLWKISFKYLNRVSLMCKPQSFVSSSSEVSILLLYHYLADLTCSTRYHFLHILRIPTSFINRHSLFPIFYLLTSINRRYFQDHGQGRCPCGRRGS